MTHSEQKKINAFHVMAKPTGARCNLYCDYCFFLEKEKLYPNSNFYMSDETMELYIRQTIESQNTPEITIAWQGGEPTLMGLDFYKRVIEIEKKYTKPGITILNTLQTNGVLLNDEWCDFLHHHNFLIGISIDGPKKLHDKYRHDKAGNSVFDKVVHAIQLMQQHKVEFNILCTVNAGNSQYPLEVYRFFRDELKAQFIQLIPIVEKDENNRVTDRTVNSKQFGKFLNAIFDEWIKRDVGEMFIQFFDGVLASYVRGFSSLCILRPACGEGVVLEHNGDVYSCDHFVDPEYCLGNIHDKPVIELITSEQQFNFGQNKQNSLPEYCKACEFHFTCHGECPKNRILKTPNGKENLNWLCEGLKAFFAHTKEPMQRMTQLLKSGKSACEIMAHDNPPKKTTSHKTGRNDPCPCGSGLKYKKCHGKQ